jgi:hypothetical protein
MASNRILPWLSTSNSSLKFFWSAQCSNSKCTWFKSHFIMIIETAHIRKWTCEVTHSEIPDPSGWPYMNMIPVSKQCKPVKKWRTVEPILAKRGVLVKCEDDRLVAQFTCHIWSAFLKVCSMDSYGFLSFM